MGKIRRWLWMGGTLVVLLTVRSPLAPAQAAGADGPRERLDHAIAAADRERADRGAPALPAMVGSGVASMLAALRADVARVERDDFDRAGLILQKRILVERVAEKKRLFAQVEAEAKRMFARSQAGEAIPDRDQAILRLKYHKSYFELKQATTDLEVFVRFDAEKHRDQLAKEVARATEALPRIRANHQDQRRRFRRKAEVLGRLLGEGPAGIGSILADLRAASPATNPQDQARRDARAALSAQVVATSARWLMATATLARSLVVTD